MLDEAGGYWLFQAERTGTLGENDRPSASRHCGFASHAAHVLLCDMLGLRSVDIPAKGLVIGFVGLKINSCRGRLPTLDGFIELGLTRKDGRIDYLLHAPADWEIEIVNDSGLRLRAL